MNAFGIKTNILQPGDDLNEFLVENLQDLRNGDIIVLATKIVSLAENRLVAFGDDPKEQKVNLMKQESEYFIDPKKSPYGLMVTIKKSRLGLKAGIDVTNNPEGTFILWPENPQESVNNIWKFLRGEFRIKDLGVVMADTTSIPLHKSFVGGCVAYCGFSAMSPQNDEDLFGKTKISNINVAENAAVIGVSEMGETNEMTPLCIIRDLKNVEFQNHVPTQEELDAYYLTMDSDVFSPIWEAAPWEKGGNK